MAVAEFSRACKRCGDGFLTNGSGKHFYCGPICRDAARAEAQRATNQRRRANRGACEVEGCTGLVQSKGLCPKHYQRLRAHGDLNFSKRGLRVSKPCGHCGKAMELKPYKATIRFYCSRRCQAQGALAAKGLAPAVWRSGPCKRCGQPVHRRVRSRDRAEYCSRECSMAVVPALNRARNAIRYAGLRRIRQAEAVERAIEQAREERLRPEVLALRRIARYVERPGVFRCVCVDCGSGLVARRRSDAHRCDRCAKARQRQLPSAKASKRIHKARRRAIERGAKADNIDPIKVFARDGWKCQLCGIKTPAKLRGTYEPNAPELDHVLPLALGGQHVWGNVQCACRKCNGAKGAKALGQLGLDIAA